MALRSLVVATVFFLGLVTVSVHFCSSTSHSQVQPTHCTHVLLCSLDSNLSPIQTLKKSDIYKESSCCSKITLPWIILEVPFFTMFHISRSSTGGFLSAIQAHNIMHVNFLVRSFFIPTTISVEEAICNQNPDVGYPYFQTTS